MHWMPFKDINRFVPVAVQRGLFDGHGIGDKMCMKPRNLFAPDCLSYKLKTCSLIGFKGSTVRILFIAYILANAKLLNTDD
ncbi:putative FBD domain-containing protein [Medicago truncatula]|uniref:FBD protein n=1 Tax=Medicago truncatula TaxID=3880 RepID=A0A072VSS7_MEDTR|nr:FBD protein [Medicago truncatula]RHN82693.1 putative FBD domain-containing protein [Medicago truncatula]